MAKEEKITITCKVLEALPSCKFRVQSENGMELIAYISGKLNINRIKIAEGDSVTVEVSPYDLSKGRIIWRTK